MSGSDWESRRDLEDALAKLRDANSQNARKADTLKAWIRSLDPDAKPAASYVTEKKQIYNRVGEQFDRGATDVIFLAKDKAFIESLASEVKKKAYPALRTVAIFSTNGSAFSLQLLLVGDSNAVNKALSGEFEVTPTPLFETAKDENESKRDFSPLVVDWASARENPPSVDDELVGLDYAYYAALDALQSKNVILLGAPGVGKSKLAEHLCRSLRTEFNSVTATAEWTTADTIGGYFPDLSNKLDFRPGLIVRSMSNQSWLIIDEINRADIDKAFGEMFSVLAGQPVTLPYMKNIGDRALPIVIGANRDDADVYGVRIDDNWRIIGTMNTVDKASLFRMSSAFMRRFAFVNVPLPSADQYRALIEAQFSPAALQEELGARGRDHLQDAFASESDESLRSGGIEIGPAIVIDFATYISRIAEAKSGAFPRTLFDAYSMFVLPQLEGRDEYFPILMERLPKLLSLRAEDIPEEFQRELREWLGVPA